MKDRDPDRLLERARELGLDLPYAADHSVLFEPLRIGPRTLPNRFAIQPMEGCDGDERGRPEALTFRRYRRYAAGGSGLIWFEATAISPGARSSPRGLVLTEETLSAMARLVESTRVEVGSGERLLILQLTHAGRYAHGEPVAAHSPAPGIPQISDDQLTHLQDDFVSAATLAARAGFDGVDIKACHGYLVSELLAARTRADSRFGGSFDNRSRFLREVIARIRERSPELIATSRFNAWDGVDPPHGFGGERNGDLAEPAELMRRLRDLGCPLVNVTAGAPYVRPHIGRPFDGCREEDPLVGAARLLRLAGGLQEAVPELPVVGTGYTWFRHHLPQIGAGVIRRGWAAMIGLGRGAFAYPELPGDLESGRPIDPSRFCITCSGCTRLMRAGRRTGCVVHDPEYRGEET